MRVFHPYGSKERLFEMVRRVAGMNLNEAILPREKKVELINKFVKYAGEKLEFGDKSPKIVLSDDENEAGTEHSFGRFTPATTEIKVVIANRNLADIIRTLAHELVHYMQYLKGVLNADSNNTGSEHENEANALAGVLLREFGEANSIIFE